MSQKISIVVRYTLADGRVTRESREDWLSMDFYCPNCGEREVWYQDGPGDFYVGEQHICGACGVCFTIQGPYPIDPANGESEADRQRLAVIRSKKGDAG